MGSLASSIGGRLDHDDPFAWLSRRSPPAHPLDRPECSRTALRQVLSRAANPTNNQSSSIGETDVGPRVHLRTTSGQSFEIVFQGRWSPDSGPDFRDAVIAFPTGRLSTGDLEIHVRASDWYRHGHQHDPAYDSVILHVVYLGRSRASPSYGPMDGQSTRWSCRLNGPIILDSPASSRGPDCHRLAAESAIWHAKCGALERLGDEWFLVKAGRLQSQMSLVGPEPIARWVRCSTRWVIAKIGSLSVGWQPAYLSICCDGPSVPGRRRSRGILDWHGRPLALTATVGGHRLADRRLHR